MELTFNILAGISVIYLGYNAWYYFSHKKITSQLKKQTEEEIEMVCTDELCLNVADVKYRGSFSNFYLSNYFRKKYFFTYSENRFYRKLCDVIQKFTKKNQYVIFSKVRVSDIIGSPSNSKSWLTINPWHFDFVICDSADGFKPVMVIELDDKSHEDPKVKKRDATKDQICEYIHLPLVRINGDLSDNIIKEQLKEILVIENKN